MADSIRFDTDVVFMQTVTFGGSSTLGNLPSASVGNDQVEAAAGIDASKLQKSPRHVYAQAGTAVDAQVFAFYAKAAGTIKHVTSSVVTAAAGSSSVTVDVRKNGTTILSSGITLDSSVSAHAEEEGSISDASYSDGDYFEIFVTTSQSGTDALPTGVMCQVDYDEDYLA